MAIHGRPLFLFLLVCFQRTLIAQEPATSCQTNQTGTTAAITFKIRPLRSNASMGFLLSKYHLNSIDIEETVVDCSKTPCKVADGYEFELAPGPVQHVKIPTFDKRFEGKYQAQYYSKEPEKYVHCTLIYQAPPNGTTEKEHPEEDTPDDEGEGVKESVPVVVILLVGGGTVLFVVVAAVYKVWVRRCKRLRSSMV